MKMSVVILSLLPACASVTVRGPAYLVQDRYGGQHVNAPVVYKASGIDRLPMQDIIITQGSVTIQEHMGEGWPTKTTTHYLKDGTPVLTQEPLYASNASNTTNAIHNLWSGVAKNLAGLAASAWTAIALGGQATAAQINSSNNATKTAAVNSAAGVEKARISADLTKALAVP
jgi:hypothetical protein